MTDNNGMDRTVTMVIGGIFLVAMLITMILAIATFDGTPTVILLIASFVFLGVGIFFLAGGPSGGGAESAGGGGGGSSQQQSVVLAGGRVVTQSSDSTGASSVSIVCSGCNKRIPDSVAFCPGCGQATA